MLKHYTINPASANLLRKSYDIAILKKIVGPSIEKQVRIVEPPIYVHRIVRYFIKAVDFVPTFIGTDGKAGKSADYKPFHFRSSVVDAVAALLNSTLFYWHWRAYSDGFHCGYGDVYRMPFQEILASTVHRLALIKTRLMRELQGASIEKRIVTKSGTILFQEFSLRPVKPVLDRIDQVLSDHYSFTNEELDYIINYDIKYRMGDALADGEEDED